MWRPFRAATIAAIIGCALMPTAAQADTVADRIYRTPTVLLIHGGGFISGHPSLMQPYVQNLRAHGYHARSVAYPLGVNVNTAIDAVRRQVERQPGPVILYGISSGGTIAAALAADGTVAGAIVVSAPTNLVSWLAPYPYRDPRDGRARILTGDGYWKSLGMDRAERRRASPFYRLNGRQSPQLIQHGVADPLVLFRQAIDYRRKAGKEQPDTILQTIPDHHRHPVHWRERALTWLKERWPPTGVTVMRGKQRPRKPFDRIRVLRMIIRDAAGEVCGGSYRVKRGPVLPGADAQASWRPGYPVDDPAQFRGCVITFSRSAARRLSWSKFCTVGVHEGKHLAGYRPPPGEEFTSRDSRGALRHDYHHHRSPNSLMHPTIKVTWPACRGTAHGYLARRARAR